MGRTYFVARVQQANHVDAASSSVKTHSRLAPTQNSLLEPRPVCMPSPMAPDWVKEMRPADGSTRRRRLGSGQAHKNRTACTVSMVMTAADTAFQMSVSMWSTSAWKKTRSLV